MLSSHRSLDTVTTCNEGSGYLALSGEHKGLEKAEWRAKAVTIGSLRTML